MPPNAHEYCLMASGGFSISMKPDTGLAPEYILGLLNSKLLFWRLRSISNKFRGGWITCTKQYVGTLPIRVPDLAVHDRLRRHDRIVSLVRRMLDLRKRLISANTAHERTLLERQNAATDRQIDRLVYELYELTDAEIAVVEEAAAE